MTEIRVFSRNPNFLAENKMQREARADREQGEASSLAARCSFTRSDEEKLFFIFYLKNSKKKKKTNIFICIRIPIRMDSWGRPHECEYFNLCCQPCMNMTQLCHFLVQPCNYQLINCLQVRIATLYLPRHFLQSALFLHVGCVNTCEEISQ